MLTKGRYKEGLEAVIKPTMFSIKAAISSYEMQGGTANIFVNDDGMQLISEDESRARQDFYDEHNIGWVRFYQLIDAFMI